MGTMRYQVFFTPLMNADSNTYGPELDVSDKIRSAGVGNIKRSIDSSDYDIGVFAFSDLELTAFNLNGYFNENDFRSIFFTIRDRCKVRVVFTEIDTVRDENGTVLSEDETDVVTFRGVINDEATRIDLTNETIRFKVLSRDSVLRTTKISGGVVTDSMTFSEAMFAILNVPKITSVLGVSELNITPGLDLVIDDGTVFDNKGVKEMMDQLLFASNSCMIITDSGDVLIQPRVENSTMSILTLYGKNDIHYRENIVDITSYNNGKQRMFTSFVVNDQEVSNSVHVQAFGFRQKKVSLDFITDPAKSLIIAETAVDEWKTPKAEVAVKVATHIARSLSLLDQVSVDYPFRLKPPPGKFLPIVGITAIGDTDQPLPYVFGSMEIPPRIKFKVIEIEDNVENFTSILKLRQAGKEIGDGYFDEPNNCIVGFAILGTAQICTGGDPCDTFNPSVIGAALVGCTQIA